MKETYDIEGKVIPKHENDELEFVAQFKPVVRDVLFDWSGETGMLAHTDAEETAMQVIVQSMWNWEDNDANTDFTIRFPSVMQLMGFKFHWSGLDVSAEDIKKWHEKKYPFVYFDNYKYVPDEAGCWFVNMMTNEQRAKTVRDTTIKIVLDKP